uniref:BTB domain-containing protein n=1 Tax=Oryza glaberrima TaxID=4538 RepID=I1QGE8_ORYGL
MASLFGDMKEKSSRSVEIRDIEPQVFGAMLGFIYTDSVRARSTRRRRRRAAPAGGGGHVRARRAQDHVRGEAHRWRHRGDGGDDAGAGGAAWVPAAQGEVRRGRRREPRRRDGDRGLQASHGELAAGDE